MQAAMVAHGAGVSVATLHTWCPSASRQAIAHWLIDERRRRRRRLHVVRWRHAGRVWAMDYSEAPCAIDGRYRFLLHVRDLASGYDLAALPVDAPTAATGRGLLQALCARTRAPLVLKVDNGPAFRSHLLRTWAQAVGTQLLYSPPHYPRYNGAIEATIASVTTRAHHAAVAAGHPQVWECADVERARCEANQRVHDRAGHTAAHRWRAASRITAAERRRFAAHYAVQLDACAALPIATRLRVALVQTLQMLGYVSITRRADLDH
jgi:transposase InsO family protein